MLDTFYFKKLLQFIVKEYGDKDVVPEIRTEIFDAFKYTDYKKLKVVIIGDEPYHDYNSIGIAFANVERIGDIPSPALLKIIDCIEYNVLNGLYLAEHELTNWCEQGILMLNTSLTSQLNHKGSHHKYWNKFTRETLTKLSEEQTGIIYCLWGSQAQSFKEFINPKMNYILEYNSPQDAVESDKDWNCPHFKEINDILENNYGKSECIDW
jgi:uracil-DNA glycosylase